MKNPLKHSYKTSVLGYILKKNAKYVDFKIRSIQQRKNRETEPIIIKTDIKMRIYNTWIYAIKDINKGKSKKKKKNTIIYFRREKQYKILPRIWQIHREWESKKGL